MKVEQEEPQFRPVTITLQTEEEVRELLSAIDGQIYPGMFIPVLSSSIAAERLSALRSGGALPLVGGEELFLPYVGWAYTRRPFSLGVTIGTRECTEWGPGGDPNVVPK